MTIVVFVASVDQDQVAQNVQPDLLIHTVIFPEELKTKGTMKLK